MHFLEILFIILVVILMICIVISYFIARDIYHPKTVTFEDSRQREDNNHLGYMEYYDSLLMEKEIIFTKDMVKLQVYDVIPKHQTKKFVVLAHGYSYSHHGSIKYAQMFEKLGYHVILFDQRFHGNSSGKYCSLGGIEKFDLYDVISYVFQKYGDQIFIGTFGESMGAATVLLEQEIDSRIHFVGADCSFSSLEVLVTYLIKYKAKLPKWPFLKFIDFFYFLATKLHLHDVTPMNSVKNSKIPIFYAHGKEDTFIPPFHSQILFDATPTYKKLYLANHHAKHAQSAVKNPEQYFNELSDFVSNIEKNTPQRKVD